MKLYQTTDERYRLITVLKSELHLAVEGRFTNLRIWTDDTSVYMRLDKLNDYSAPLNEESVKYLHSNNKAIDRLLAYGFKSSIDNLQNILDITAKLPYRMCNEW